MKSGRDSYIFCCVTVFQLAQLQMKAKRWRKILSPLRKRPGGDQADRLHQPSLPLQLHCRLHHLGNNSNYRLVSYWCNGWFRYFSSLLPFRYILRPGNHSNQYFLNPTRKKDPVTYYFLACPSEGTSFGFC